MGDWLLSSCCQFLYLDLLDSQNRHVSDADTKNMEVEVGEKGG